MKMAGINALGISHVAVLTALVFDDHSHEERLCKKGDAGVTKCRSRRRQGGESVSVS